MAQEEFLGSGLDKIQAPVEDLGLTKSGQPRKRRQKPAMDAREVLQRQNEARIEKERAKAQKKKARSAKTKTGHKPSRVKSQGKGKGKSKDGEKNKQKGLVKHGASLLKNSFSQYNGNDIIGQRIIDQLFQNDPIADALLHHDVGPEPTIQGRQVKTTQFALLFANIPENENATSSVKDDKKKLREASKSFGYAKCKAHDGKWLIKGMKSKLYHHQLLGAQWMVQRELSSQPPHGGLLADSMGLGKTVQTLACMVGNPPGESLYIHTSHDHLSQSMILEK
jgi:SNF2 family DNA or RNA helicase